MNKNVKVSKKNLQKGRKIVNQTKKLSQRQRRRVRNVALQASALEKWIERKLPGLLQSNPTEQAKFNEDPTKYMIEAGAPVPGVKKSRAGATGQNKNAVALSKSTRKFGNALNAIYATEPGEVQVQFWWLGCDLCKFAVGAAVLVVATAFAIITTALLGALIAALVAASGGTALIMAAFVAQSGIMLGYQLVPNMIEALTKEVCVYRGKCSK